MLFSFVGNLTGIADPVRAIVDSISQVQIAKAKAANDTEKLLYEYQETALMARLEGLKTTQKSLSWRIARFALTFPVIFLMAKLLMYDRALGQWTGGRTDALSIQEWGYIAVIIGGYFTDRLKTEWDVYRTRRG